MNLSQDLNWYAIYTKRGCEDLAAIYIRRLGLNVFLPRVKLKRVVGGILQTFIKPLFPSYLFARFCPAAYLHLIQYARGVNHVVCAGEVPLPVDDRIIDVIESHIGKDGYVRLEPKALLPGDRVIVQQGPFQGFKGLFARELNDRNRVVILLEGIEYEARVMLERPYLKAVERA